jgi:sugar phosphate isomerase/epimerase
VNRTRRFAISTHLIHGQRLHRDHLREIAANGFEAIELFATRTHFDYHNDAAVADLQQWLTEAGLELRAVHAPVVESFTAGRWGAPLNLASSDGPSRDRAVAEAMRALHIARRLAYQVLVVHIGVPKSTDASSHADSREAARRSVEMLLCEARPLGVTIAVEVIPNALSSSDALVRFVESTLEVGPVTICLDLGHAHLEGDVAGAVETVSEHIAHVHVHDNHGRQDDHLIPFQGTIEWPEVLTTLEKVGYDGSLVLEVAPPIDQKTALAQARDARVKLERLLWSI